MGHWAYSGQQLYLLFMHSILVPLSLILSVVALAVPRRAPWAYPAFLILGLLYFPARVGFHFHPRPCEVALSADLAERALHNFPHMIQFAWCSVVTISQFPRTNRRALAAAAAITLGMGAMVEIAEGITGRGNCRLRDLIPDAVGAVAGFALVMLWYKAKRSVWSRIRMA